jgi:hypothetical protein
MTQPTDIRRARKQLTIVPLSFADACEAVDRLHRHHKRPVGHKFSLGLLADGHLAGAAMVGRPVARALDTGWQVEVIRLATDGTANACSALYGAAWRTASAAGYLRALTYTQDDESGASLRAAGWRLVAVLRPRTGWDAPSRPRQDRGTDGVVRMLWEQSRSHAPDLPPLSVLRNAIRNAIDCTTCGKPIPVRQGRGRRPRHCSNACRQRAHRIRHAEGKAAA